MGQSPIRDRLPGLEYAYASDGAQYGLGLFVPMLPALFALAYVVQEMSMRVGAVTHRGYGELVLQRYGSAWGWFAAADLTLTNLVTLVAEFVAIRVGLAYFGLGSLDAGALGLADVLFTFSFGSYWRWERIVLGLALFNGLFLLAALFASPHLRSSTVGHLPGSFNTLLLLLASTIGATVTPWMIFFQQGASADKGMTPRDIPEGRVDTAVGAILAALFGVGALVAGAALLGHGGIGNLSQAAFPGALRQVAGDGAGALFALGLIEAGAVAILTISASTAYAAAECVSAAPARRRSSLVSCSSAGRLSCGSTLWQTTTVRGPAPPSRRCGPRPPGPRRAARMARYGMACGGISSANTTRSRSRSRRPTLTQPAGWRQDRSRRVPGNGSPSGTSTVCRPPG